MAEIRFPAGIRDFLFCIASRPVLRPTETPAQWAPGGLSPVVKRPEYDAHYSPTSSDKVKKNGGDIPPLPLPSSWRVA
jgi:hypothetical protein